MSFLIGCGGGGTDSGSDVSTKTTTCATLFGQIVTNECPWPVNIRYLESVDINSDNSVEPIVLLQIGQALDIGERKTFRQCKAPGIPSKIYKAHTEFCTAP